MPKSKPRWWRWLTENPFSHGSEFRWLIGRLLSKRKDVCWTEVVMWAMFEDFGDVWDLLPYSRWYGFNTVATCRRDARINGCCYCGKFATQSFAEDAELLNSIIVTETIEPEDENHGATLVFKGEE